MELDDKICYCFHVKKRKVLNFIRLHQPKRASQLSECNGAGTGCGWCIPYLKRLFEQAQDSAQDLETIRQKSEPTPEEYARERAAYIQSGKGKPPAGTDPQPKDES